MDIISLNINEYFSDLDKNLDHKTIDRNECEDVFQLKETLNKENEFKWILVVKNGKLLGDETKLENINDLVVVYKKNEADAAMANLINDESMENLMPSASNVLMELLQTMLTTPIPANDDSVNDNIVNSLNTIENQEQTQQQYEEELSQLEMMGFVNKTLNLEALIVSNGDVEMAVSYILST